MDFTILNFAMPSIKYSDAKHAWVSSFAIAVILGLSHTAMGAADASAATASVMRVDGGSIHLILSPDLPVAPSAVDNWVHRAAIALGKFYGRYPVPSVWIHIQTANYGAVGGGHENNGDLIHIHLGPDTTAHSLLDEWMMTHEMFHLSQPDIIAQPSRDDSYSWMSEGMADYLEPVARARSGQISPQEFWKGLVEGLPNGLPKQGDRGLDHTPAWGRTYWGGSLFWLMADIQIRQQTNNAKSVRDAAKAVLDAGGNGSQGWTIDRLLKTYDQGTGTKVFQTLHDEMGGHPWAPNLNELWKSLGVVYSLRDGTIEFNNCAKLAYIRRGITEKYPTIAQGQR